MLKKIKNIKNTVIVSVAVLLVFGIGSLCFLIASNIRMSKEIDRLNQDLYKANIKLDNIYGLYYTYFAGN